MNPLSSQFAVLSLGYICSFVLILNSKIPRRDFYVDCHLQYLHIIWLWKYHKCRRSSTLKLVFLEKSQVHRIDTKVTWNATRPKPLCVCLWILFSMPCCLVNKLRTYSHQYKNNGRMLDIQLPFKPSLSFIHTHILLPFRILQNAHSIKFRQSIDRSLPHPLTHSQLHANSFTHPDTLQFIHFKVRIF